MVTKDYFSLSFETEQAKADTYLVVTGIVLFASVLTISSVQARGFSPVEVVVYEGEPIDYSNRDDVVLIDDTYSQSSYSTVELIQDFPDDYSSQTRTIANNTSSIYKPQTLSNARSTQPKVLPVAVKRIDPITQVALSKPFEKPSNNAESKNPELVAFYADVLKMQRSNSSKQSTPSKTQTVKQASTKNLVQEKSKPQSKSNEVQVSLITSKGKDTELVAFYADVLKMQKRNPSKQSTSTKTKAVKQALTKNVVQKKSKSQTKTNEVQLASTTSKGKAQQSLSNKALPNKALISKVEGKDPELVAFYMDVFAKQNNNLSNQSISSKTLIVKQLSTKNVAQQKTKIKNKSSEVQLSLITSKGKDPELVAFYKQVFENDTKSSYKPIVAVATAKAKDPELVAFYEREFGKSTSTPLMPVLANKVSSKIKVATSTKSVKKRIVKKVKVKTTNSISTELAELQDLIDDLTDRKII